MKMKLDQKRINFFIDLSRFNVVALAVLSAVTTSLFFISAFKWVNMVNIYDVIYYLYLCSLLIYAYSFMIVGLKYKEVSFVILPMLYFIIDMIFGFPELFPAFVSKFIYLTFMASILLGIFSIYFIIKSRRYAELKKPGIVGVIQSSLSLFFLSMAISFSSHDLPVVLNILMILCLVSTIILSFVFFISQFKFFSTIDLKKYEK